MILLFVVGALSMLAQVVILRELVAALFGVELLYVVALGAWLAGTAAGSFAGRRLPAHPAAAAAGCVALGLLVPAELVLVRTAGAVAGAVPGAFLPFPLQLLAILAAAVPPAAVCGLVFPALTGLGSLRDRGVSHGYAVESAGAAVGGAIATAMFWLGASTLQVAILATAAALSAAAVALARRRPRVVAAALALLALTAWAGLGAARPWDLALLRWQYPSLVDAVDTPYARVAITRSDSQLAVFQNGAFAFDTEGTSAEAFADLSALQHPGPRRALVIGGGLEGVPAAIRAHGVSEVDCVEVDARAYEVVRAYAMEPGRSARAAPEVRMVFAEPRRFLEQAQPYDVILVATGEPTSGASSRFYTQEFFRQCARRLTAGGVLAVRLPAAENVWPLPLARRTASIVSALQHELASVEVVPGATLYLFASDSPLPRDPAILAARLRDRGVPARLMTPPYLKYLYSNDRRDEVRRMLAATPTSGPNRDGAPVCYQYAAMLWLSRFYPGLAVRSPAGRDKPWWLAGAAVLACAGAIAWLRRRPARSLSGLLFGAGFIGMVIETVLLLRYQIASGVVFQQVGWLLTCFMAGLTGGGWLSGRGVRQTAASSTAAARQGFLLAAALSLIAGCVWAPSVAGGMTGLGVTSLMLLAAGLVVGAWFGLAAAQWPGDRHRAASSLYAADVAGGAAGAVLATLVLVPVAGLDGSALLMAVLAAALSLLIPRRGGAAR